MQAALPLAVSQNNTISLNSSDFLPIPQRGSSIQSSPLGVDDHRIVPPSQLSRYTSPADSSLSNDNAPPSSYSHYTHELDSRSIKRLSSNSTASSNGPPGTTGGGGANLSLSSSMSRHTHQRSNSLKRKPVPPLLALSLPNPDLPADHPFNAGAIPPVPSPGVAARQAWLTGAQASGLGHGKGKGSLSRREASADANTSGSEPGTPGYREDKDLFFAPQQVQSPQSGQPMGLPPPRRNFSKQAAKASASASAPPAEASTPSRSTSQPVPVPVESVGGEDGLVSHGLDVRRGTFDGFNAGGLDSLRSDGTPTPTKEDRAYDYNRPLPPLPDNASMASLGMSSVLGTRPYHPDRSTRSNSSETHPPATPRTDDWAPTTPQVHGMDLVDDAQQHRRQTLQWPGILGGPIKTDKAPKEKEKKLERRVSLLPLGEDEEDEVFSVDRPPSKRRLWEAGTHFVRDEEGKLVCFSDLFPKYDQDNTLPPPTHTKAEVASLRSQSSVARAQALASSASDAGHGSTSDTAAIADRPSPKTVVFFIRFFWCGQCQDYTYASIGALDPEAIRKANIRVVIISNGNWKHIRPYRKLFNCPFPIYVDGSRKLYSLMGMNHPTSKHGPWFKDRPAYNQRSVPVQVLRSVGRLTKLPKVNPGSMTQLGGEFILEPGFECSFAHRMTTRSNHMEAVDVVRLAGCEAPTKAELLQIQYAQDQQAEMEKLQEEMLQWREKRETELDRMRRKKAERRGQLYTPISQASNASRLALGLEADMPLDQPDGPADNLPDTPAFGPTHGGLADRRESEVSVLTIQPTKDIPPEIPEASPLEERGVSMADEQEADARGTEEVEELEAELEREMEDEFPTDPKYEEEMNKAFEKAMKIEEAAKKRFERGSWGESKAGRVRGGEV